MAIIKTQIKYPTQFRLADFLEFHQRDTHRLAEKTTDHSLHKGIFWNGMPACLALHFNDNDIEAHLDIDAGSKRIDTDSQVIGFQLQVQHLLGLNQKIEEFEKDFCSHPVLGTLVQQQSGLRVPQSATPFEALTWAITGQQISLSVAISLRRKLILLAGVQHSSGIWCYPDASRVSLIEESELGNNGFSQAKARTLLILATTICDGALPLDFWLHNYWRGEPLDVDLIYQSLISLRGIGPWTINYALLRGFGWLDGSLHGDVAVRNKLQQLLHSDEKITEKYTQEWLKDFSPWRALVAAHLWKLGSL